MPPESTTLQNVPPPLTAADDETAWLEATAESVRDGRWGEIDSEALAEYLFDIARRDRREVESRLTVLLLHWLKWNAQPQRRMTSWRGTLVEQRQELAKLAAGGVLRRHAEAVLAACYADAVERAVAETGLAVATFSNACPFTLDELLTARPEA